MLCSGGGEEGQGEEVPFAAELRQHWWQAQPEQQLEAAQGEAAVVGGSGEGPSPPPPGGEGGANLRDRVFRLALPQDWQVEAAEPPGLACTLFRYQRRCLAWLKWRESLGGGWGGASGSGAAAEGVKPDPEAGDGRGAAASPSADAAPCDQRSRKAALPGTSLLWQPLLLPSGLRVWANPLEGGVRRRPVGPPLPEVSGGLLCEEMGLGERCRQGGGLGAG